ncbi:MAG: transcription-repair coupling factor [Candidatus Saganbacteria bacterium]|nr:transcription-repair coupling factor [Candidatus Saganbacteria bacterium]
MPIDKILRPLKESSYYTEHLLSLKRSGKTSFTGMVGSSSSALLACLAQDFKNILVVTKNTERAEAIGSEIKLLSGENTFLFPALDTVAGDGLPPSRELVGERLAILEKLADGQKMIVVAPVPALISKTNSKLSAKGGRTLKLEIRVGAPFDLSAFIEKLVALGFRRFDIVGERGEFSVRGGIIDVFPLNFEHPVRIELVGDRIESIRSFDAYCQRSLKKLENISILPAFESPQVSLFSHLSPDTLIVLDEPMDIERVADSPIEIPGNFRRVQLSHFLKPGEEGFFSSVPSYVSQLETIKPSALIVSRHAARLDGATKAAVCEGSLSGGFKFSGLEVIGDKELFSQKTTFFKKKTTLNEGVADELLADLKVGDYVVHENYGIALYQGTATLKIEGIKQEYILLSFARGDKVYVPPSMAGLVEKYSSGSDVTPKLSRLGTKQWSNARGRVKAALKDMTAELLELYSTRQKVAGYAFAPDDIWQEELRATFPFFETPDQIKAIGDTKSDMETSRPMDRLICGDVGYGKTEVALRACAKAVSAGKQVAILVPTTILAEQHYNNFRERFKTSPFIVEMLSRFKSKKEQAKIVKSLAGGAVDIVIGTHRLLSRDIKFRDLGLLVVDEEQRFGVGHKERIKKLKKSVDVLSMSATPIPRTLYLSLSGARDMSVIATPPVDRSPIRTYVLPWNESVIREAILREIDRGGQVYFVHNVVETIEGMANKIRRLVPEATITVGHGQMREKDLEKTMIDFLDRKFDVLVCTSIIESGLDIQNVNTILIDNASRFGLSQLYQIRGRVGRSPVRAYAYLFYHPQIEMTDQALERLKAIQEFTALGSGYKLAMRDLEIRGAGNLLGAQQSGHVMEVGFDLYCELLEEAVREAKGIKESTPREVSVDLKVEAFIPKNYVLDDRQRIALYRRMNLLDSNEALREMRRELKDRFGAIPDKLERLFELLALKVLAIKASVKSIKEEGAYIIIERLSGKKKKLKLLGQDKIKRIAQEIA